MKGPDVTSDYISAKAPRVYLEVDSLEPADVVRSGVVEWLDEVYRETLAPLAASRSEEWTVGVLADPPDRWWKVRGERTWLKALEMLSLPNGALLELSAGESGWTIRLDANLEYYSNARRLYVFVEADVVAWDTWQAFQQQLIEHLAVAAETVGASTGFIGSGSENASVHTETTFEHESNRSQEVGLAESERWLRGVFWCTLLSQGHLEALGGIERVEREAPVAQTRRLSGPTGPMLLLQASDDLADFDAATLAPLFEFLAPVLPEPTPLPEPLPPRPPRPEPTIVIDPDVDADAVLRLRYDAALDEDDQKLLDQLLDAWYLLAVHGIFDGSVHNMDARAYEQSDTTNEYTIGIDLGSAGTAALDPLVRLLLAARDEFTAPLLSIRAQAL